MVEKTYKCDICRETYAKDDPRLVGFSFGAVKTVNLGYVPVIQAERHVCTFCLRGLVSLAAEASKHGHN